MLLSHVHIGVVDFDRAVTFYAAIMQKLGFVLKFSAPEKFWAGWMEPGVERPLFLIGHPFNGETATLDNGQMVALLAPSRIAVDQTHALAIQNGDTDLGSSGLRPHYPPDYYGAYFNNPDGNKICVCCHAPAAETSP